MMNDLQHDCCSRERNDQTVNDLKQILMDIIQNKIQHYVPQTKFTTTKLTV